MADFGRGIKAGIVAGVIYGIISGIFTTALIFTLPTGAGLALGMAAMAGFGGVVIAMMFVSAIIGGIIVSIKSAYPVFHPLLSDNYPKISEDLNSSMFKL